jgi:hypothetical protein
VGHFYKEVTGSLLEPDDVPRFLNQIPAWRVFIAAQLHVLWVRAVNERPPGKKKAGAIDTDTAVYLTFCDRFLTHDKRQFDALTVANRYNPRKTRVQRWSELRDLLML